METDINVLDFFFKFIVITFSLIIISSMAFAVMLNILDVRKKRIKFYGVFLDLSNIQIYSISIITIKLLFLLYSLFFIGNNYITLMFILFTTVIFNLLNLRLINLFINVITNMFIYFILISKDVFIDYIRNVSNEWYIIVLLAIIMLFEFMFILYIYLKELDFVLKKNKYIKKVKNSSGALNKGLFKEKALRKQIKELKNEIKEVKGSNNEKQDN